MKTDPIETQLLIRTLDPTKSRPYQSSKRQTDSGATFGTTPQPKPSTVVVEPGDIAPDFTYQDAIKDIKISTFPGYHLPHVWLAADGQTRKISSLDLCGRGAFTLLTGIGGAAWIKAAQDYSSADKVQIRGYAVGVGCDYMDCYRDWQRTRGVSETGVVLVRPDHFVAWRCQELVEDPVQKIHSVMQRILGQ
ncbi:hypothetical protein P168DRAFT_278957 [Aspergillus campestris IBT 28561]|uniref:FAD-binding domain-containing protein n=1 Tax=Aspergillus campestris (strain IBT 28561) TaxID=1392248 RepID=A0A2I1DAQ2_ASPC2|nr:uncharacterized protein P168DRAFT_278957 [Aspergillus campestris IBT 28561]PKY06941.1 hypothetical protein P168DRAFT_278957 [Aspergillus campestris IBT 28561]